MAWLVCRPPEKPLHWVGSSKKDLLAFPGDVSELKNYKLSRFSSERLLRFVTLLDRDVEIVIRPKAKGHAAGVVSVSVV